MTCSKEVAFQLRLCFLYAAHIKMLSWLYNPVILCTEIPTNNYIYAHLSYMFAICWKHQDAHHGKPKMIQFEPKNTIYGYIHAVVHCWAALTAKSLAHRKTILLPYDLHPNPNVCYGSYLVKRLNHKAWGPCQLGLTKYFYLPNTKYSLAPLAKGLPCMHSSIDKIHSEIPVYWIEVMIQLW